MPIIVPPLPLSPTPEQVVVNDQFGAIFQSYQFDDAVTAFIRKWVDTYLSEQENRAGIPRRSITRPKSYNVVMEADKYPEDQLPAVLVVSAGLSEAPDRVGLGTYNGLWGWTVSLLVSQRDEPTTRKVAALYGSALRAMFMQHPDLEGAVADTMYDGETYAAFVTGERSRTMAVTAFEFRSYIEGLVQESQGPLEPDVAPLPDDEPYPNWPIVQTTEIEIDKDDIS